jgi:hypothetical protein
MTAAPTAPTTPDVDEMAKAAHMPVDLDLDVAGDLDERAPVKHRTFKLRGEVFRAPSVNIDLFGDAVAELDAREGAKETTLKDVWNAQADFITACVHPDDLERFNAIRARQYDSLEPSDLRRLYRWLWEVHTGRPTQPAAASLPGPASSDPSSKGASGSPVVGRPS